MTNIMKFLLTLFLFLAAAASLVSADKPLIPFQDPITISPQDISEFGELVKVASSGGVANANASPGPSEVPKLPVSPECLTALLSIVASPEFLKCMPLQAFAPLIKLLDPKFVEELFKDPAKNVPPLFGPVFDGWCPAPKCSEKGVAAALQTVQTGCKADADKPLIQMITTFIVFFSPIKDSACFKNETKGYCLFETLQKVYTLPPPAFPVTKNPLVDSVILSNPVTICTGCNKAIVNTFLIYVKTNPVALDLFLKMFKLGESGLAFVQLGVSTKCGQQFDDGKVGDPTKGGGLCSNTTNSNSTGSDPTFPPPSVEQQLSLPQDIPIGSGATSIKGISLLIMMGSFLVSTFFMI